MANGEQHERPPWQDREAFKAVLESVDWNLTEAMVQMQCGRTTATTWFRRHGLAAERPYSTDQLKARAGASSSGVPSRPALSVQAIDPADLERPDVIVLPFMGQQIWRAVTFGAQHLQMGWVHKRAYEHSRAAVPLGPRCRGSCHRGGRDGAGRRARECELAVGVLYPARRGRAVRGWNCIKLGCCNCHGFSKYKPMWDESHVFVRLTLVLTLMFLPREWDLFALDPFIR